MKKYLKKTIWRTSDFYLTKLAGQAFAKTAVAKQGRHVVVLTPSSVGNLGDEAMVTSIVTQLRARDANIRITLITHAVEDATAHAPLDTEVVCLSGYFSKIPARAVLADLAQLFQSGTDFILLGADILDGRYSESRSFRRLFLARNAQEAGMDVFVLGFSFSDNAVPRILNYMDHACRGFTYVCRDPLSAGRVAKAVNKDVPHGADLAFLLNVPETPYAVAAARAYDIVQEWQAADRPVIAFNGNPLGLLNAMPDVDLDQAATSYANALNALAADTGCALLCLTHDNRPAHSDARFMQRIIDLLEPETVAHFVPETVRATDIKFLCSKVDLTVTGRMHMGIASLGAGTTTMILDFQGKVRGLYELFGLPELAIDVLDVMTPEVLVANIAEKLKQKTRHAEAIKDKLPDIHTLSERNLEPLFLAKAIEE